MERLRNEYAQLQTQIDREVEKMHSNGEALRDGNISLNEDGTITESSRFEQELAKLEKQLSQPHAFASGLKQMESVVHQNAEQGGMLREVVDNLSERLAAAQLEIDGLKEQLRKAKTKQELRQLYQKMAYSDGPPYNKFQSAHLHMNHLNKTPQRTPLQSGQTTPIGPSPLKLGGNQSVNGEIQMVDDEGKPVMRLQDAMGVLIEPDDYSPSGIVKGCKSVYASGLVGDQLDAMHDRGIVPALLDIIKKYGQDMREHPENELVVGAALQALAPLLDDKELRKQFLKEDGIDVFDDLYGPNMNALDHMYPVSGRIAGMICGLLYWKCCEVHMLERLS